MSQYDLSLPDVLFPAFLANLQAMTKALSSKQAGAVAPTLVSGAGPNSEWADQTAGLMKIRNNADSAYFIRGSLAQASVRSVTSNPDTILATDAGNYVFYNSASAVGVTLPQAVTNFGEGWRSTLYNVNAGLVTITPTTSTINGAATLELPRGYSAEIISLAGNYVALLSVDSVAASALAASSILSTFVGVVLDYGGAALPTGFLWAAGQNVSRTTYATLFARYGTTYGVGDGSTTFGLPDLKGRATFGRDDMNGAAASRVTAAGSGITGTTLGAAGGSQLLHQHSHGVTDPGHSHVTQANYLAITPAGVSVATGAANWNSLNAVSGNTTGISIQNAGSGNGQNMPPAMVLNKIIYAGV